MPAETLQPTIDRDICVSRACIEYGFGVGGEFGLGVAEIEGFLEGLSCPDIYENRARRIPRH